MENQQTSCSDQELLTMLRSDEAEIHHAPLLEHVETCTHCQQRLSELAATEANWNRAAAALDQTPADRGSSDDDSFIASAKFNRWSSRPIEWDESMVRQLLDSPSHPEMLGRLGRYEIERLIGSGGMGVVFKAHDSELNRPVAIKLLAPYLASSGAARNRFAREARSAAGVVDDHVVPIFNVESDSEPTFLVMQYVAGGSLQEKLDRDGPLDVAEVVRIGLQVAKGLAAAHAQGLIHRDVKPSNILLDEGVERAMLTDFGLARAEGDASLTRSGFHPGTPHYMSPEQVRGESIDGRSDLFGLGCVLYAACAGHPPFRAESSYAVLRRITDEAPRPLREVNSNVPEWLESIVMKLLAKSSDDRFQSAEEVAELLEDCLAHVQQPTVVPLPDCSSVVSAEAASSRRRPPSYFVALALAIPLLLAGIFITLETSKGTITIESEADNVPIVIKKGGKVYDKLTVSRDGKSIRVYKGNYEVSLSDEFDTIAVENGNVTLQRGDEKVVRIRSVGAEKHVISSNTTTIDPNVPAKGDIIDAAELLKKLRERDKQFSERSIKLERTWNTPVQPRAMAHQSRRNSIRLGGNDPGMPAELPDDYEQPHRIHYLWTAKNFDSTLEILADLEKAIHPQHEPPAPRILESDCFAYRRTWNRDQKIFVHSSDITKLNVGNKAWEYLLPSGIGFSPSIRQVTSAARMDDGYILKGLLYAPSATIGKRLNCFEFHLDNDLILRRAIIQYHVYDYVISTSGSSQTPGLPPTAKRASLTIYHIGQDEKRTGIVGPYGEVGNYKYEVVSISDRLSKEEYERRIQFRLPKGTKLAVGINQVETNLDGFPGVIQVDDDEDRNETQSAGKGASSSKDKLPAESLDDFRYDVLEASLPEEGVVLVMFDNDSDVDKQMRSIARRVAEAASVQLLELPQGKWRHVIGPPRHPLCVVQRSAVDWHSHRADDREAAAGLRGNG